MKKTIPEFVRGLEIQEFIPDDAPIIRKKTPVGEILFFSYGETTEFRVRTLMTKEPETINWINSFESGSVFWDIGANVGIYSLYASFVNDVSVTSFEPSSASYFVLNKNIFLNNKNNIKAYNIAFSDKVKIDTLHMASTNAGDADCAFATTKSYYGNELDVIYKHSCIGFSIDDFINMFDVPIPNYIKIDVDGIELLILKGASSTLHNKAVKSLLVEVNEDKSDMVGSICQFLKDYGFNKIIKRHAPDYDNAYYKPSFNYIFYR